MEQTVDVGNKLQRKFEKFQWIDSIDKINIYIIDVSPVIAITPSSVQTKYGGMT